MLEGKSSKQEGLDFLLSWIDRPKALQPREIPTFMGALPAMVPGKIAEARRDIAPLIARFTTIEVSRNSHNPARIITLGIYRTRTLCVGAPHDFGSPTGVSIEAWAGDF